MSDFHILRTSALDELLQYIKENGGIINPSIQFIPSAISTTTKDNSTITKSSNESFLNEYGIYVTEPILEIGTKLITIPFNLCITAEMIVNNVLFKDLFVENSGLLDYPDEILCIGLMHAKLNPSSTVTWSINIKILPEYFNTTIFWNEEELDYLKGNMSYHLTKMMLNQIETDYQTIHLPLSKSYPELLHGVTKDLYKWALSIVYSRALEITRNKQHIRCIVPLLDMANHNPCDINIVSYDTFVYNDDTDSISLITSTLLDKDQECTAVYGLYCNAKLLYTYGFVILNNPYQAIDLWVRLPTNSYAYQKKNEMLQSYELTKEQTYDFKGTIRPQYVSPALLTTIRIIQADEYDLQYIDSILYNKQTQQIISLRNEKATYISLRNLIITRMNIEQAEIEKKTLGYYNKL